MQYLNWEPAFIVVRTRVLCMVHVWVTWAVCLQLEEWDRFLWNCLHWAMFHLTAQETLGRWISELLLLAPVVQRSLYFPHKHTQQLNRTSTLWALQEAMQRFLWVAWGKDKTGKAGNSSLTVLCSQLDCSLPYTSSSEVLQRSCLVFLHPCIRGL